VSLQELKRAGRPRELFRANSEHFLGGTGPFYFSVLLLKDGDSWRCVG